MHNNDYHGKQRRGSSPQQRDTQQPYEDWMRGFQSHGQPVSDSKDSFQPNLGPAQPEGHDTPTVNAEVLYQQSRDDEGHWQDDGGEAG
jgi:hypothetical protein